MKKVSMKDIAKELNTSITTVSFVINGKSAVAGNDAPNCATVVSHIRILGRFQVKYTKGKTQEKDIASATAILKVE